MNKKVTFNKSQLQLIAIAAMVIDHIAWGFVDFRSPLGQIMHVAGRLTIPIMCYFIAEGFRKTHDLKAYIGRLATFAIISIIPFYIFFHKEYGYRQNVIFDHLLSLLLLTVLEHKELKRWQKTVFVIALFAVSVCIAGWPLTPELFTLAFYYGKTFKDKVKWFVAINLLTVGTVSLLASLNRVFYFSLYDWTWYDRAYLLGFMLALPVLARYNGESGKPVFGRYFFYAFYPIHMVVLSIIRYLTSGAAVNHDIYVWFHIVCLVLNVIMLAVVLRVKPSRMQSTVIMFLIFESFYIVGFITEIMATKIETLYMTSIVEYFGELFMLIAVLLFTSECGRIRVPSFLFMAHVVAALALLYSIGMSPKTGFFYSSVGMTTFDGYAKPLYVHSTGYYLSVVFIGVIVAEIFFIMVNSLIKGSAIERRRVAMIFAALMFIWIPYAITLTGITGGYEIPGLGVVCAAIFLTICFFRYGSLDSVALASENALGKAGEGVIIIDDRLVVTYSNAIAGCIAGDYALVNTNAKKNKTISHILSGEVKEIECGDKIYEVRLEELKHSSFVQGYTIWFLDATRHRELLDEAENMAFHDALTGLYNRRQFERLVARETEEKRPGTLVISDMDNFKAVNDNFGHKRGDKVLTDFAEILKGYSEEFLYPCRIGGDEFMFYLRGQTNPDKIEATVKHIMEEFGHKFRDDSIKCTLSVGIVINEDADNLMDFGTMYREADKKLYTAKEKGKNTYVL